MPRRRPGAPAFPDVRILTGAAFELIAQLAAFTSGPVRPSLDSGKAWIREVRALAGPELIARVDRFSLSIYAELATVALEASEPRDVDALIHALETMAPAALRRRLVGADSSMSRSMVPDGAIDRALDGDRPARAELHAAFAIDRGARRALDRVLDTEPAALREELTAILRDWDARVFKHLSAAALGAAARDAARRSMRLAHGDSPADVVKEATRGVAYNPPAWITSVVLVPTVALRPFIIPAELGATAVFICSVADESIDEDPAAPPRGLVKVIGALGDERRLRVLRLLRDAELNATEIAERLGVDRTSLHHHLGILRSAGLLTIHDDGVAGWRYRLRPESAKEVAAALEAYLGLTDT